MVVVYSGLWARPLTLRRERGPAPEPSASITSFQYPVGYDRLAEIVDTLGGVLLQD
jgi:hypothetical protein